MAADAAAVAHPPRAAAILKINCRLLHTGESFRLCTCKSNAVVVVLGVGVVVWVVVVVVVAVIFGNDIMAERA